MLDKLNPLASPAQSADAEAIAPAAAQPSPEYMAKATKAAVEFESFFISHMLQQMRESTRALAPEDSPLKDPVNSDMLDMADKLLAGHMAGQRAFGVADAILKQLLPPALNKAK
jgi:flagellar protein FlgJ